MDDLISRKKAIRLYCREHCGWEPEECGFTLERDGTEDCYSVRFLKELPSAHPEQRTGKWIKMSDADGVYYCCSECGEDLYREWSFNRSYDLFPRKKSIDKTKYCPNCGAIMDMERE